MKKPIEEITRIRLSSTELELELEPTERKVHLSPTVTGTVYAIVGVASSDIDVVVTDDFDCPRDERDVAIAIVSKKSGKYDGAVRDRIVLRRVPGHQARDTSEGEIWTESYGAELDIHVGEWWHAIYRQWTHEITDLAHAGDIVRWHWSRYYSFLPEADIATYAEGFGSRCIGLTLAAANRMASRELYAMARSAGWRKLTLREQSALGLEGQWHRDEAVLRARASSRTRSGCGEHTLLAASMAAYVANWLDS
jgi:hypothetical protein